MKNITAVEWLEQKLREKSRGMEIFLNAYKEFVEEAKEIEKQMLCDLVEQLKDYTHQSKSILGHDEREPIEFVEIFLTEKRK
jgi:hypothetical protein